MDIHALAEQDLSTTTAMVVLERSPLDGKPTAGLYVVGMDSPQYQEEDKRQRAAAQQRRAEAEKNGAKFDPSTPEGAQIVMDQAQVNARDRAFACTVGWFGMTDKEGNEMSFDKAVIKRIYENRQTIVHAALEEIGVGANFLPKGSEKPAASTRGNSRGSTRGKKQ